MIRKAPYVLSLIIAMNNANEWVAYERASCCSKTGPVCELFDGRQGFARTLCTPPASSHNILITRLFTNQTETKFNQPQIKNNFFYFRFLFSRFPT